MSANKDELAKVKKYSTEALRAKLKQCGFNNDDVHTVAREQLIDENMVLRGHGVHQFQKAIGQQTIASVGPLGDMGMFMQMFMQQQQQLQKTDAFMQIFMQQQQQQQQQIQLLAICLKFSIDDATTRNEKVQIDRMAEITK